MTDQMATQTRATQCPKHGCVTERGVILYGQNIWFGCPMCAEQRKAEEARRSLIQAALEIRRRYESIFGCWVPQRYCSGFSGYRPTCESAKTYKWLLEAYADAFDPKKIQGEGFTLTGSVGTGKTHLACAVLLALWPRIVGAYTVLPALASKIRTGWNSDIECEMSIMHHLKNAPLLIIDEVGSTISEYEKQLFFQILDARYSALKPTICITNLSKDQLETNFDERIVSRLWEVNQSLAFKWEDYRLKKVNVI